MTAKRGAVDCAAREKSLWSAIEDYKAGSCDHRHVQQYVDLFASAERLDEAIDQRGERQRLFHQVELRDDLIQRLVAAVGQHKSALNVALAYARTDIGWNDETDGELAGCQIVLDEPVPAEREWRA